MSLRATAQRISASVGDADDFADALVQAGPDVKSWLASASPSPGCPEPPPEWSQTKEHEDAWRQAHTIKESAKEATPHHQKMMAHHIRKHKRKDGTPISEPHAESLAASLISNALSQSQEEIASDLME